jgi:hypothetical protein
LALMFVLLGSPLPPLPRPARFFFTARLPAIETIAVPHLNHDDVEPIAASLRGSSLLRKSEEWNEP